MKHTRLGFSIRAIGANDPASRLAGITPERCTVQTFLLAGAFAGLAGALIVQGRDHSLLQDFSANFGFLGIGVALVARLHPLWIIGLGRVLRHPPRRQQQPPGGRRACPPRWARS